MKNVRRSGKFLWRVTVHWRRTLAQREQVPAFVCCRWLNRRELDLRYQAQVKEKHRRLVLNVPTSNQKMPRVLHFSKNIVPCYGGASDHSSLHKRSFMTLTRQNDYKLRTLKHFFKKEGAEGALKFKWSRPVLHWCWNNVTVKIWESFPFDLQMISIHWHRSHVY